MAKNKQGKGKSKNVTAKRVQAPAKKKSSAAGMWTAGIVAVLAIVAVVAIVVSGSKGATPSAASAPAAAAPAAGATSPTPDEQKYIGRLLPAGYTEPSVAAATSYSATVKMSDLTAKQTGTQLSIPLSDVVSDKIVYFEYQKSGSDPIPMTAYIKPSGKLFVGVGYCVPCKGERQRIDADGTLTCESCGTKRDLETGVGISGTCKLYPLDEVAATVKAGSIVVPTAVLEQWTAQPLDRPVG